MLVFVPSHAQNRADGMLTLYAQRAIGKPAPMANTRETEGPSPARFEIHRTLVAPSWDADPIALDGVDCATKQRVFVSLRRGAADHRRLIMIEVVIISRSVEDPTYFTPDALVLFPWMHSADGNFLALAGLV